MACCAAVWLLGGVLGGVRSADKTVMYGVSLGLGKHGRRFVPRTLLSKMLFPAFCALWARLLLAVPFAVPLGCTGWEDGVGVSRVPKADGSTSTRGASDMIGGAGGAYLCV